MTKNKTVQSKMEEEGFITKADVAHRLKRDERTISRWMRRGIIPYYKVGHGVFFRWDQVKAQLDENCRVSRTSKPTLTKRSR